MTERARLHLGRRHGRVGPHPHGGTLVDRRDGRHATPPDGARPSRLRTSHAHRGVARSSFPAPRGKSLRRPGMNRPRSPLWWLKLLPTTAFLQGEHHDHRSTPPPPPSTTSPATTPSTPATARLGFVARHAMVTKVRGQFGAFEGTARIDDRQPVRLQGRPHHRRRLRRHRQRRPRRPPQVRRLLRRRDLPHDPLRLHRREARRRRLGHHRRPDHQGRHQVRHDRLRADRLGRGPVRQHPRRLRGRDHRQPQGLRPHLERRARDRRRPRLREDQARVRHLGDQAA